MNEKLNKLLPEIEKKIIAYRRDLHKHAEAGWAEYRTTSLIAGLLEGFGFKISLGKKILDAESRMGLPDQDEMDMSFNRALSEGMLGKYADKIKDGFTGVVGELQNGEGPTIAFRFDIDAIELQEKKDENHLPYKMKFSSIHDEAMHACGHDGHTAIGLGLAEVLSQMKDEIKGRVKLIFQPAEEGVRGSKAMVEAGVVDDVDYIFGMHIGLKSKLTGEFYCGSNTFLATSKFDVFYKGLPSHAGIDPQKGKNALLTAASAVLNLYAIPRHGGGATRINVGKLTAGSGRNIIPDSACLVMETRGENSDLNKYMVNCAEKVIKGAAEMHGTEYRIVKKGSAECADSDDELVAAVHKIAENNSIFSILHKKKIKIGGSEDFTHMMKRVADRGGKASYFLLGSELSSNHHTSNFNFNESVLINGVKILSLIALELKAVLDE